MGAETGKQDWHELPSAFERFMVRGYEVEAEMSRQRRASAVDGIHGNGGGGGNRKSGRGPDQGNAERGGEQEE